MKSVCSGAGIGYICIWIYLQEDRKSLQCHIAEIQPLMKWLGLGLQSTFETSLGEEHFLRVMSLNYSLLQRKEQLKTIF